MAWIRDPSPDGRSLMITARTSPVVKQGLIALAARHDQTLSELIHQLCAAAVHDFLREGEAAPPHGGRTSVMPTAMRKEA